MKSISKFINPIGNQKYKVVTSQEALSGLIEETVMLEWGDLYELKLFVFKNVIHLKGMIKEPLIGAKKINIGNVFFNLILLKDEIHQDKVLLSIKEFSVFDPTKRVDLVKIIDRYSSFIRERILENITNETTPLIMTEPLKKITFDLKYLINRCPIEVRYLGNIRILNIGFESKKIIWYIESNILIKSLIDYFGPDFIDVQELDTHTDPLKLLTDFQFDDMDEI